MYLGCWTPKSLKLRCAGSLRLLPAKISPTRPVATDDAIRIAGGRWISWNALRAGGIRGRKIEYGPRDKHVFTPRDARTAQVHPASRAN